MEYKTDKPVEVNVPMRENTLDEVVAKLPPDHRARRELTELRQRAQPGSYPVEPCELNVAPMTEQERAAESLRHSMEGVTSTAIDGQLDEYIRRRRRIQRIEVASRILAGIFASNASTPIPSVHSEVIDDAVVGAVLVADQLLTRIDETE